MLVRGRGAPTSHRTVVSRALSGIDADAGHSAAARPAGLGVLPREPAGGRWHQGAKGEQIASRQDGKLASELVRNMASKQAIELSCDGYQVSKRARSRDGLLASRQVSK